jgi:hypothetical protein
MTSTKCRADQTNAGKTDPALKAEIDTMLAKLTALSDDHFETHSDKIQWGNVGDLNHYVGLLRQITDSAFSEGEFAE